MEIKLIKGADREDKTIYRIYKGDSCEAVRYDKGEAKQLYEKIVNAAKNPMPDEVIASTIIPDKESTTP